MAHERESLNITCRVSLCKGCVPPKLVHGQPRFRQECWPGMGVCMYVIISCKQNISKSHERILMKFRREVAMGRF